MDALELGASAHAAAKYSDFKITYPFQLLVANTSYSDSSASSQLQETESYSLEDLAELYLLVKFTCKICL